MYKSNFENGSPETVPLLKYETDSRWCRFLYNLNIVNWIQYIYVYFVNLFCISKHNDFPNNNEVNPQKYDISIYEHLEFFDYDKDGLISAQDFEATLKKINFCDQDGCALKGFKNYLTMLNCDFLNAENLTEIIELEDDTPLYCLDTNYIEAIFNLIDRDSDGFIDKYDIYDTFYMLNTPINLDLASYMIEFATDSTNNQIDFKNFIIFLSYCY
ncbi:hypothetical protein HZS_4084 [Henneguya salminicola]|nr:hypothetical protein HZS_4084 [Henneguya salminicola]